METRRRPLSREKKRWPQHGRDGVYAFDVPHWLIGWGHTQISLIWHEGGWRLKDTQRAALGELHSMLKNLHTEICDGSKENCPAWVGYEDERGERPTAPPEPGLAGQR